MNELEEARQQINDIDQKMAELFVSRMECAKKVADYKRTNGMQVFDAKREQQILDNAEKRVESPILRSYYVEFMATILDVSKKYQHQLLEGNKVAYSGIEGAFANIAAKRLFPEGNLVSYPNFKAAYDSVVRGECNLAVLPIENSYAGEVGPVMDLMFDGSLFINGVYSLQISQNLLGVKGSSLSDIKRAISHPQALDQCADYLQNHGIKTEQAENTAIAAKQIAELNDKALAAIASEETAELYGLEILERKINTNSKNTTRFAVFSKAKENHVNPDDYSTFIMMFKVNNEAGSLAKALDIIGKYGYNMRSVHSRPLKSINWEYYFYIEAEGKLTSEEGQKMIKELGEYCQTLKVLGSYSVNAAI